MIRSTFYGFGTGLSGMNAAQKALDVVGNNISNLNTPGYTRQRLDLYSAVAVSSLDRYTSRNSFAVGQGVDLGGVSQIRDPFLDVRFRREAANVGESDAQLGFLEDITGIFDEVQSKKIQSMLSDFKSQLEKYSLETGSAESDSIVRTSAESLTRMMNQLSKQLETVKEQQLDNVENAVININNILDKIGTLNQNIKESELFGNQALELKDQRNSLIDQLSSYMPIEVTYEPDPTTPSLNNVVIRVKGTSDSADPNSNVLVRNDEIGHLSFSKKANGDYNFSYGFNGAPEERMVFDGGSLKGFEDMLNSKGEFDTPPNTLRGIGYYQNMLDTMASEFAKDFNEANTAIIDGVAQGGPMFATSDGSAKITAGNISIAKGWSDGSYSLLTTKKSAIIPDADPTKPGIDSGNTDGKNDNINHMIRLLERSRDFLTTYPMSVVSGATGTYEGSNVTFKAADGSVIQFTQDDSTNAGTVTASKDASGVITVSLSTKGAGHSYSAKDINDALKAQGITASVELDKDITVTADGTTGMGPITAKDPTNAKVTVGGIDFESGTAGNVTTKIEVNATAGATEGVTINSDGSIKLTLDSGKTYTTNDINKLMKDAGVDIKATGIGNPVTDAGAPLAGGTGVVNIGTVKLMSGKFSEFAADIGNKASMETNSKTTVLTSHVTVLSGIEDLRDGISAVSLDEEGVDLMRYQKSYAAAARFMTTLDDILNTLINGMGI